MIHLCRKINVQAWSDALECPKWSEWHGFRHRKGICAMVDKTRLAVNSSSSNTCSSTDKTVLRAQQLLPKFSKGEEEQRGIT